VNILSTISRLWPVLSDASEEWDDAIERLVAPDDSPAPGAPAPEERDSYRVVDVTASAASARYRPSKARKTLGLRGRVKRTLYKPVDLRHRRVVLVMHQMGVSRSLAQLARRAQLVTAQEVLAPDGTVYVVHPDETRLIAANRFNRDPYHAINFELAGNLSYIEGKNRFYKPDRFGRTVMTPEWETAVSCRLVDRIEGLRAKGIDPFMLAPHRVAGHDRRGNANREACCASAGWAICEQVAAITGVPVPGDEYTIGGLPIPEAWRTKAYAHCRTVDA